MFMKSYFLINSAIFLLSVLQQNAQCIPVSIIPKLDDLTITIPESTPGVIDLEGKAQHESNNIIYNLRGVINENKNSSFSKKFQDFLDEYFIQINKICNADDFESYKKLFEESSNNPASKMTLDSHIVFKNYSNAMKNARAIQWKYIIEFGSDIVVFVDVEGFNGLHGLTPYYFKLKDNELFPVVQSSDEQLVSNLLSVKFTDSVRVK
jgi:hypothetical protein